MPIALNKSPTLCPNIDNSDTLLLFSPNVYRRGSRLSGLGLTDHWKILSWEEKLAVAGTMVPDKKKMEPG